MPVLILPTTADLVALLKLATQMTVARLAGRGKSSTECFQEHGITSDNTEQNITAC